ncbi:MAG TPA: O-antigen ligase family protein [Candidatus Doudnabacteria bacterium]|nr:O-antigen ligase family protein [Candidatus Doudnabacteria bacterium]
MRFVKSIVTRETFRSEFIANLLLLLAIVFAFIPIKYVLSGYTENILGRYSDFTAISVYLSLIFVVGLGLWTIYSWWTDPPSNSVLKFIGLFIAIALLYITFLPQEQTSLGIYSLTKIACGVLVGYHVYKSEITLKYKDFLLWTIVGLGAINAVIALIQFGVQSSIGLNLIGESPLSILGWEIAKSVAHGTTFIRSYGLFPHANILGAVLVIISLLNLYLINKSTQYLHHVGLFVTFCLISAGIFASQSRAALLSMGVSYLIYGSMILIRDKVNIILKLTPIVVWLVILLILFFPWLSNRTTLTDTAVAERVVLAETTAHSIADNWLLGTGPGTNLIMLHGKLQNTMDHWLIQPVHNYLLINISDFGLVGFITIILILFLFIKQIISSVKGRYTDHTWSFTLSSICIAIFILFWFDHYFYTYWPAQLLLAVILGLIARELRQPKRSENRGVQN